MDLQLKGKRALVMGSSTGIGKAIAQSLIQEGAQTVICARNEERLRQTAIEIGADFYIPCDLGKSGSSKALVEAAIQKLGGIDILITNTGGPHKGTFLEIGFEQWREDFQNLWLSVVEALHAALPTMKSNNFGRVVLITSLAAKEPLPNLTSSNGLRAGLPGLVKSIANEYASNNISLNLILPGYTDTDRLKELNLSKERIAQMVPAGRLCDPKEIGDLASFLCSPLAGYITGQSIAIDGGALRSH